MNSFHVAQNQYSALLTVFAVTGVEAVARSFAGLGHVVYAGFSGYYLGLAKLDPENRGPIIVKGLLIASLIHGTYDTAVSVIPKNILITLPFIVIYIGFFFVVLYRKLARCRMQYREPQLSSTEA
ncbi:PrsW family intramembrane metalloprotease [Haladaptatus pallidirubidus]|uniref:PrsW family intramembrane metalloprotease n=1 Tax=Haladaptatus pallidirubidus TaxID=1008152 RepID=A0AAV3UED9_9EURY|nr:PrsW family intramembrane metalloprotease [Haladaptatus pallidirubidus]